jgi:hypothetical protein
MVEGPIPANAEPGSGGTRDYPFLATPIDLASRGYVEEEFFLSGTACRWSIPTGSTILTKGACDQPYKTRVIVRRPASAEAFNGTVLAEWQNVTAQYEVDHYWHESSEHIIRSGYVWVGVSAQRAGIQPAPGAAAAAGINSLKSWSPTRYGTLGVLADDSLRFEIFSQAVQALRSPTGTDPLGPLDPEVVVALGTSQSGSNLAAYQTFVYPTTQPVVDAFFIGESRGVVRGDLAVPVFRFLSEVDVASTFAPADAANYRQWEVAGASHAGAGFLDNIVPLLTRDQVVTAPTDCARPAPSRIPKKYAYNAAFDHIDAWVRTGALPPIAPRITFTGTSISRDTFGNALGGIQLSEHRVATAENSATNSPDPSVPPAQNVGGGFCRLFGTHVPFTEAQLDKQYRNHGRYVSQVARVNEANVAAGYLLPVDAEISTSSAARSAVGR